MRASRARVRWRVLRGAPWHIEIVSWHLPCDAKLLCRCGDFTPNPTPPKPLAARTRRSPAQLHARAWAVEPQDLDGWVGGKRKIGSNVVSKILIPRIALRFRSFPPVDQGQGLHSPLLSERVSARARAYERRRGAVADAVGVGAASHRCRCGCMMVA